jgi:hypothetical protein
VVATYGRDDRRHLRVAEQVVEIRRAFGGSPGDEPGLASRMSGDPDAEAARVEVRYAVVESVGEDRWAAPGGAGNPDGVSRAQALGLHPSAPLVVSRRLSNVLAFVLRGPGADPRP